MTYRLTSFEDILRFGKYKNYTVEEVLKIDPPYFKVMMDMDVIEVTKFLQYEIESAYRDFYKVKTDVTMDEYFYSLTGEMK